MSDAIWASAITGATAVLTGLVGYGTARGQRMLDERRVAREEADAERTKQADLRQARSDLYADYLQQVDGWWRICQRDFNRDVWLEWFDQMNAVDNKIELFGSEGVQQATVPLVNAVIALDADANWEAADLPAEGWRVFNAHEAEIHAARETLLKEMRADIKAPS